MNAGVQAPDGTSAIDIKLRRCKDGVRVRVRVEQSIESFFERWSGGAKEDSRGSGRLWAPYVRPSDILLTDPPAIPSPLVLWSLPPSNAVKGDSEGFALSAPGHHLILDNGVPNLSMIRLVGASRPEGVEFLCDIIASRSELERIAGKIRRGSETFYSEYIQPVGMHIYVGTKTIVG